MQMENVNENLCKSLKHTSAFCSIESQTYVFHVSLLMGNFSLKYRPSKQDALPLFFKKTVIKLINAHDQRNAFSAYCPGSQQQLHA